MYSHFPLTPQKVHTDMGNSFMLMEADKNSLCMRESTRALGSHNSTSSRWGSSRRGCPGRCGFLRGQAASGHRLRAPCQAPLQLQTGQGGTRVHIRQDRLQWQLQVGSEAPRWTEIRRRIPLNNPPSSRPTTTVHRSL